MSRSTVFGRPGLPQESRPKLGLPKKPKAWSHQDELQALRGKPVEVRMIHLTGFYQYVLLEADAFVIQLYDAKTDKSTLTYKHQIAEIRAV